MVIDFDHYHGFEEMAEILEVLAEEHPNLCSLYSIGQSTEGRELWLMEITNKETGPAEEKPAVYVDGNTHASEVTGQEVLLSGIRNWSVLWLMKKTMSAYREWRQDLA